MIANEIQKTSDILPSNFLDYKIYLQRVFQNLKEQDKSYTYNQFGLDLGFPAPNIINQIIKGRRPLSLKAAQMIVKKLKLTGVQRKYIITLVDYNNSRSTKKREELFKTLMNIKSLVLPTVYDKNMLEFFSCWYHPVIRDMVGLPDFRSDPVWIAKRIFPQIRPEQAKASLNLLEKLGLIYFDQNKKSKNGYVQTKKEFSTGPQLGTIGIARFHQMMIENGKQAITRVKKNERDISGISICIPKSKVEFLKTMIQNFQQQLLESEEFDQKDNEIYQINIQLFPVTQTS